MAGYDRNNYRKFTGKHVSIGTIDTYGRGADANGPSTWLMM